MKEKPPLDAVAIEKLLESRFFSVGKRSIAVPNVTALGHESDFLFVTGAGYVLEVEIKVTIADFRADLRGAPLSPKWMRQEVMSAAAAGEPVPVGWRVRGPWRYEELDRPLFDPEEALADRKLGLARLAPTCPNRFAYAYPEELHDAIAAEAPPWAGLMPYTRDGFRAIRRPPGAAFSEKLDRPPKLLHRTKVAPEVRDAMLFSAYHRFWNERRARRDAQETAKHLSSRLAGRSA